MTDRATSRSGPGILGRAVRDPLCHFLAGGALLFGAWTAFSPQAAPPPDPARVEITEDDLRQIALGWISQGRPLPSPEQLRELALQAATQQILVREALALGLDQDDEIIARRLAQKMDFLLADLAALDDPTDEALRAWYEKNGDRFTLPPRASFRHLYFAQDARGLDGARRDAADTLPVLAALGPDDQRLDALADRFMFRDYYGGRTPGDVAKEFGPEFADALFAQDPGGWVGPIRSGYGWHLVWIDAMEPGSRADFAAVRGDVKSAWIDERYREIRERAYDEMLSRYTIVIPDPGSVDLSREAEPSQIADQRELGQ